MSEHYNVQFDLEIAHLKDVIGDRKRLNESCMRLSLLHQQAGNALSRRHFDLRSLASTSSVGPMQSFVASQTLASPRTCYFPHGQLLDAPLVVKVSR